MDLRYLQTGLAEAVESRRRRVLGGALIAAVGVALAAIASAGTLAAVIAGVGALGALVLAFPRTAYGVVLATLPLDVHARTAVGIDALFDPVRLLVVVAILFRYQAVRSKLPRPVAWSLLGYLAVVAASLVYNTVVTHGGLPYDSYRAAYKLATYVGYAWCTLVVVKDLGDLQRVYWLLLIGAVLTGLYSCYQYVTGAYGPIYEWMYPDNQYPYIGRPPGLLAGPNSAAAYINLILPVLTAVGLYAHDRPTKALSLAAAGLSTVALALTQSRGGWVAGVVVIGLVATRVTPRLLRLPLLLGAGVAAGAMVWLVPFVSSRITDPSYLGTEHRVALWNAAWTLFVSSPVVGIGYGSYEIRYADYLEVDFSAGSPVIQAHNLYLQLLAETGVLGLVTFILVVGFTLHRTWIRQQSDTEWLAIAMQLGIATALIGVLVHGLVDVLFLISAPFAVLFWVLVFLATCVATMAGREAATGNGGTATK